MPRLFISHAGVDTWQARELAEAVDTSPTAKEHGLTTWIDERDLDPAYSWQEQLEDAISKECSAFALLLTNQGAENWVRLEVRVAIDRLIKEQHEGRHFPFIPVIADDVRDIERLPVFARQYQGVRLQDPDGLQRLIRAAAGLDRDKAVALVDEPFMGLDAFESKDAALFFGRQNETKELVERLKATNFVLVIGDSGSGKSSLVRAGLVPAFREGAFADRLGKRPPPEKWHVIEMRPGNDPFEGLVEGCSNAAKQAGKTLANIETILKWIRSRDPNQVRDAFRETCPPDAAWLLVVDQFEELWTRDVGNDYRTKFIDCLVAAASAGEAKRRVVATMRRDYYHLCADHDGLKARLTEHGGRGRFLLASMSNQGLREAVTKPLLLAGVPEDRASALADEVVKDVAGQPGNLALLEMALAETWRRGKGRTGDLALAYEQLDRLEGALANAAREAFWNPSNDPEMLSETERPSAEALFMRLALASNTGSAARRIAGQQELVEAGCWPVAQKLATRECRRLVVIRHSSSSTLAEAGGGGQVELAHEQLVTQWTDYQAWLRGIGNDRNSEDPMRAGDKRTFDRLIDANEKWRGRGKKADDLARGGELELFEALLSRRSKWPSNTEREYIEESQRLAAKHKKELERQARNRLFVQYGRFALVVLTVLAGLAAWQWREAESERTSAEAARAQAQKSANRAFRSESLRLAALADEQTAQGDAVTGMLLALEALPRNFSEPDRPVVPEVWSALREAMAKRHEVRILRGQEGTVKAVAFSSDGTRIVVLSENHVLRVWRTDGTSEPLTLLGHGGQVLSASFSPDGSRFITASEDGKARIWRTDGASEPLVLVRHTGSVRSVGFSRDGLRVITGSEDGTARIGSANGEDDPIVLRGPSSAVRAVAFSNDGTRVVTGSDDGGVRVWRSDGTEDPILLGRHDNWVLSAAFSRDDTKILTGSQDNTAKIWSADGTGQPDIFKGHEGPVQSAAFSPNGSFVVTGSLDGTARIWAADGAGAPTLLRGHIGEIWTVAWSPDSTQFVSGSKDGTARIWRVHEAGEPMALRGHVGVVTSTAFSLDGIQVITGSLDGTARAWRADGSGEPLVLRGHDGGVFSAAFSPDGMQIVTGSSDGTARIWRADGSGELVVLRGHKGQVLSAVFSPDGTRIVTGSVDGTARVWRADGSGEPLVLRGHEDWVWSAAFSRDGTRIVTGSDDGTARVWQADGSGEPLILLGHKGRVKSAAFSPDGTRIVTGSSDGTARVWRADGSGEPQVLRGQVGRVYSAAFSPDGTRIATGAEDGTAWVWRADGRGRPLVLRGHQGVVLSLAFSQDGTRFVTGSDDGTAWVFPLVQDLPEMTAAARQIVTRLRELTPEQRRRFYLEDASGDVTSEVASMGELPTH